MRTQTRGPYSVRYKGSWLYYGLTDTFSGPDITILFVLTLVVTPEQHPNLSPFIQSSKSCVCYHGRCLCGWIYGFVVSDRSNLFPRAFPLKMGGEPFFNGKALGTRLRSIEIVVVIPLLKMSSKELFSHRTLRALSRYFLKRMNSDDAWSRGGFQRSSII